MLSLVALELGAIGFPALNACPLPSTAPSHSLEPRYELPANQAQAVPGDSGKPRDIWEVIQELIDYG